MSSVGSNEVISGSKIEPLESEIKRHVPHNKGEGGVVGEDKVIDQARIEPGGGKGHYQHPEPHADSSGVVGRDKTIVGAKIEPFTANKQADTELPGLQDEDIDASRISPLGEVREEFS